MQSGLKRAKDDINSTKRVYSKWDLAKGIGGLVAQEKMLDRLNILWEERIEIFEKIKPKLELEIEETKKQLEIGYPIEDTSGIYYYKGGLYTFDKNWYTPEEKLFLILELEDNERQKFERLKRKFSLSQKIEKTSKRESIQEAVRIAVWRRDEGKCTKCGSRKNLEYDHIIPVSKGGGNTIRNIELLCEECNRKKRDNIE